MNLAISPTALYTTNVVNQSTSNTVSSNTPITSSTVGDTFTPSQSATTREGVNLKQLLFAGILAGSHLLTGCEGQAGNLEKACNAGVKTIEERQQAYSDRLEQQLAEQTGENTSQGKLKSNCPPTK